MKEYIERASVHDLVKSLPRYQMFNYDRTKSLIGINPDDVDFGVDEIPAADVAPVVRCRECRKWDADPDSYGKDDGPKGKCMKSFEETYDNDFCSYGERREADHDKHPSDPV